LPEEPLDERPEVPVEHGQHGVDEIHGGEQRELQQQQKIKTD
jgi:hypothetical protein